MKRTVLFILLFLIIITSSFGIYAFDKEKYVLVEGGVFMMGSNDGDSDEKPAHQVILDYNFIIGKYEVTFEEYDAYCEDTGKSKPEDENWGRGKRPVIYVSWNEAVEYCNWLSEEEGIKPAYDSNGNLIDKYGEKTTDITKVEGYRLPTEAEWEYAARGGKQSQNYKYSGSNDINTVAWYGDNSKIKTHEVGTKIENELGIFDMSGNVWEWCIDWLGDYSNTEKTNPVGPTNGSRRILRGGSWCFSVARCRVSFRNDLSPSNSLSDLGFRICRTE